MKISSALLSLSAVALTLSLTPAVALAKPEPVVASNDAGISILPPDRPGPAAPDYRFLSAPDFLNGDVANVRRTPKYAQRVRAGATHYNSTNERYETALDVVMDRFAAERPNHVYVAGDLVNGHWGRDQYNTGVFGPVRTEAERRAAIDRAANLYYSTWLSRFEQRNLPVFPAVGDHELGDNPWRGHPVHDAKREAMDTFKAAFARNLLDGRAFHSRPKGPAHATAYAHYVNPEVLLITLDVFKRTDRDVLAKVDRQQLAWMEQVLSYANRQGTDWIIVQGHTPILGPVRHWGSSHLGYQGGRGSALWKLMARKRVDLYLSGEVHDVTAIHRDGITQISHGGIFGAGRPSGLGGTNYLLGEVRGSAMSLRINRFEPYNIDRAGELWQIAGSKPVIGKSYYSIPPVIGSMEITKDQRVLSRTGRLAPYHGE